MDRAAGIVLKAPSVTKVRPTVCRLDSGILLDTSSPRPNASAARVATTKPNVGGLNTMFFICTSADSGCKQHAPQAPIFRFARGRQPRRPEHSLPISNVSARHVV